MLRFAAISCFMHGHWHGGMKQPAVNYTQLHCKEYRTGGQAGGIACKESHHTM